MQTNIETFPFKRESYDPIRPYRIALDQSYAKIVKPKYPIPTNGLAAVPLDVEKYTWYYKPVKGPLTCICDHDAYDLDLLTDIWAEHVRLKAKRQTKRFTDCISPLEDYQKNHDIYLAEAKRTYDGKTSFRLHFRETIYKMAGDRECSTFKISWTQAILTFLKAKKVLDPSAGWGDRLLGASLAGVETYHGIDPNTSMSQVYYEMSDFAKQQRKIMGFSEGEFKVITEDFLVANIPDDDYDTVFTGPPFYDYELYSDDDKQSYRNKTDINDWINTFFFPYLNKAWSKLKKGGKMALYVSDISKDEFYVHRMIKYVSSLEGSVYEGNIAMNNGYGNKWWPIWIWTKK